MTTYHKDTLRVRNLSVDSLPALSASSEAITFNVPLFVVGTPNGFSTMGFSPADYCITQTADGSTHALLQAAPLPRGIVSLVQVYAKGAAGHGGLPSAMPSVFLQNLNASTGALTDSSEFLDTSANTTAYQTIHAISCSQSITTTAAPLLLMVTGEANTNYIVGLKIYLWAAVTMSITSITPQ